MAQLLPWIPENISTYGAEIETHEESAEAAIARLGRALARAAGAHEWE